MRPFVLLPLIAVAAIAQTRPADLTGWDKIKWGMTLAEVHALYPDAAAASDRYWSHLKLPAIHIADIPLEVTVSARKPSDQVSLIALWCYYGLPTETAGAAPNLTVRDFDALRIALFRKYGAPRDESRTSAYGDAVRTFIWVFRSGSLELQLTRKPGVDAGSFRVEYRAAGSNPL